MSAIQQVRIHGPNDVRVDLVERPSAGPRDVVVEVAQCGICGSDLSYVAMGGLPGGASPMRLGHEFSGVVVEAGAAVEHIGVGDRVVVNPEGAQNGIGGIGSEGAFTPLVLVRGVADDPLAVLRLPDSLSFEQGALVEPLSVGMHAVRRGRIQPGDKVVIFGAGTIGLAALLALRSIGVDNVVSVDLSKQRLAVAESLGAIPVHANGEDLAPALRRHHGESLVMGAPAPASDVYIEATGVGSVFEQLTQLPRVGGRIVVVGVHKAPVELNLIGMLIRELEIIASLAYPDEFPLVLDMLASGKVDPTPLVTHRFGLSQFPEAFATAQDASRAIKVIIDCQA